MAETRTKCLVSPLGSPAINVLAEPLRGWNQGPGGLGWSQDGRSARFVEPARYYLGTNPRRRVWLPKVRGPERILETGSGDGVEGREGCVEGCRRHGEFEMRRNGMKMV